MARLSVNVESYWLVIVVGRSVVLRTSEIAREAGEG